MALRLSELAALLPAAAQLGLEDPLVSSITHDSRKVKPGDVFLCVPGQKSDGHDFLADAARRGAAAAIVEHADGLGVAIPLLVVPSTRAVMGPLAAAVYDYPSRAFRLVGITGTNGKTTTSLLVEALFRAAGCRTGVIGTLGARIGDRELPGDRTTPEAPDLQALFAEMAAEDVRAVAMEVSSHALALDRALGTEFDVGVFTNLTQDHLDFHETLDAYFAAKARLFTDYPDHSSKPFSAVINRDDPYGQRLRELARGRVVTYGIDGEADLRAAEVRAFPAGICFQVSLEGAPPTLLQLRLGGRFNVSNALAALGVAWTSGLDWERSLAALAAVPGIPGRFESVDAGQEFAVVVDYAHSPDGLLNVLNAARALEPERLIAVFGCGGDRDRGKRPIMGRLAAELADVAVVTSDNPRSEDPAAIIREITAGIEAAPQHRARVVVEPDRRAAIAEAIHLARPGDLVLIAGKGHENYQIFADRTIHFDDREVAREVLKETVVDRR
jgi:UDP-N-acetylmuramoyl-L-alanyl-D-glutamate--2,6-diaminopimelate ligase